MNPDPWDSFVADFLDRYEPTPPCRQTVLERLRNETRYKRAEIIYRTGGHRAALLQLHTAMEDAMHHMIREGKDHA